MSELILWKTVARIVLLKITDIVNESEDKKKKSFTQYLLLDIENN